MKTTRQPTGPAANGTWETGFQAQQMAIDTTGGKAARLNCSTCVDERHRSTRAAAATQRVGLVPAAATWEW
jgi:hypothetical protein